jgi:ecotin
MKTILSIASLVFVANVAIAADNMKAFPPAEPGTVRYVIELPALEDETTVKVELIIGKMVSVDAHNRHFFGGNLEKETIKGWGFDRYILRKLGPMAGTLMAVDPNAPKVERFVTLGGEPRLIRYNSRLPLVVYVPSGVDVRYRIWRADPTATPATQG